MGNSCDIRKATAKLSNDAGDDETRDTQLSHGYSPARLTNLFSHSKLP